MHEKIQLRPTHIAHTNIIDLKIVETSLKTKKNIYLLIRNKHYKY